MAGFCILQISEHRSSGEQSEGLGAPAAKSFRLEGAGIGSRELGTFFTLLKQ